MQFQQRRNSLSMLQPTHHIYTHSKHESGSVQHCLQSATSTANLNIDKLIGDIKITPLKQNKYTTHIDKILNELQSLKELPRVIDEIHTIQLLVDSIKKKITCDYMVQSRMRNSLTLNQKQYSKQKAVKIENVSPIKEILDQYSNIAYTKFSLSQITTPQKNGPAISSHSSTPNMQTPSKQSHQYSTSTLILPTPSNHSHIQDHQNQEMEKLSKQIVALQKMLKLKGVAYSPSSKKKPQPSNHQTRQSSSSQHKGHSYKQSQNLCPVFRKISFNHPQPVPARWKVDSSKTVKGKNMQAYFR